MEWFEIFKMIVIVIGKLSFIGILRDCIWFVEDRYDKYYMLGLFIG